MIDPNDPVLLAFLLDELDADRAAEIEAALAASPELRAEADRLRQTIGMLRQTLAVERDAPELLPAQLDALASAAAEANTESCAETASGSIAEPAEQGAGLSRGGSRTRWIQLSVAALILLMIGFFAALAVRHQQSEKTASNQNLAPTYLGADSAATFDDETTIPDAENGLRVYPVGDRVHEIPTEELKFKGIFEDDGAEDPALSTALVADPPAEMAMDAWTDDAPAKDMMMMGMDFALDGEPISGGREFPSPVGRAESSPTPLAQTDDLAAVLEDAERMVEQSMAPFSRRDGSGNQTVAGGLTTESEAISDDSELFDAPAGAGGGMAGVAAEREGSAEAFRKKRESHPRETTTWKPATAAINRARLSVGHQDDSPLVGRDTYVRIDGFRARVLFDCYYYNDRPQQLEGRFLLRLPSDASLHSFAFGVAHAPSEPPTDGPVGGSKGRAKRAAADRAAVALENLRAVVAESGSDLARRAAEYDYRAKPGSPFEQVKSARIARRQKSALAYEETVRRRVDPALVEWAGPGVFQTRVFPLMPNQLHRIVIGYDVSLREQGEARTFELTLPEGEAGGRVEFDIATVPGMEAELTPTTQPFVSGGRAFYQFSHAEPRDYTVRLSGPDAVVLNSKGPFDDSYFATRLTADLPDAPAENDSRRAVFLLDTSWSDRPAAFSRRVKLLQAILDRNRDSVDQFAVLFFNVEQRWWRRRFVDNDAANVNELMKVVDQLALEGATDLHAALAEACQPSWSQQAKESPSPNFFLLSDGVANWGRIDHASLGDPLAGLERKQGGGALFAYHLAGSLSDRTVLGRLAEESGGAVFDVAEEAELSEVATAHRSRPWTIIETNAAGADEILVRGAGKTVYPQQTLVVAGRGRVRGLLEIVLARGGERKTLRVEPDAEISSPMAARLYGELAVDGLEPFADALEEVTVAFSRYFRVPGRTCSLVMLETADDYARFGADVPPAEDQLVIASTSVTGAIETQRAKGRALRRSSRDRFLAWVASLESASLLERSTALRLAMDRLPPQAFRFDTKPLLCRSWKTGQLASAFASHLRAEAPSFDLVINEAEERRSRFGSDDAIKAVSTLVEARPFDPDLLRSVAFRTLEWERADQAAPLLWRLVQARPYQPQGLLLLGRAMLDAGDVDAAIVCYDLVCRGNWNQRWQASKEIAAVELLHALEKVDRGDAKSVFPQYVRARLAQLRSRWSEEGLDVAIIMHWNTDRTDVDLHVTEPSGEECFYSHPRTQSGGRLTQDVTQGLGPEMYTLPTASAGDYRIEAKYYRADANRTHAPTEVWVTAFQNLGRETVQETSQRVTLGYGEGKRPVLKLKLSR